MSQLGRLVIELSASTVEFAAALDKAARLSEQRAAQISKAMGVAATAVTALAAAGAALAKSAINEMDALSKLSQRVGVSVESLSSLKYAAELADVSTEALGVGLKKLSVNMFDTQAGTGEARAAFKALGVEVKNADGTLRSSEAVLAELADRFAGMEDGAGKTALAVKLFGKSGADMIPLLNQGAAGLAYATDEARRFGLIVSTDAAKAAEQFNDNLTRLQKSAGAVGISLATPMLKNLVDVTDKMNAAAQAAGGFWQALANPSMSSIANPGEKILELESSLAKMKQTRDELSKPGITNSLNELLWGDVRTLNTQIAATEKQLALLRQMQGLRLEGLAAASIHRPPRPAPSLPDLAAPKGDKQISFDELLARNAATRERMLQELEDKATEAARRAGEENQRLARSYIDLADPVAKYVAQLGEIQALREKGLLTADQAAAAEFAVQNRIEDLNKATQQAAKSAFDFGFTFNSALEDSIINGAKLSEVLKGLTEDIARMVLRQTVTAPLAGALSSFVAGMFGGGPTLLGGPGMTPSYATGTDYVPETGLALIHKGEAIIPASENAAGREPTVVQNIHFQANGPAAVRDAVLSMLPAIRQAAIDGVADNRRRGR